MRTVILTKTLQIKACTSQVTEETVELHQFGREQNIQVRVKAVTTIIPYNIISPTWPFMDTFHELCPQVTDKAAQKVVEDLMENK